MPIMKLPVYLFIYLFIIQFFIEGDTIPIRLYYEHGYSNALSPKNKGV